MPHTACGSADQRIETAYNECQGDESTDAELAAVLEGEFLPPWTAARDRFTAAFGNDGGDVSTDIGANIRLHQRRYWSRSLDGFEALAGEFPESLKFRQRYAQAVSNEGSRLAQAEDAQEALPVFVHACELYSELVAEAPWDATNQHGLAMALGNQAMLLATDEQYEAALEAALGSLEVWDTYLAIRPDDPATFRQAVIWKTAELLAHQAAEALSDDPERALELVRQELDLVNEHWEHNQLLRETVTLQALELALAEAVYGHVESLASGDRRESAEQWLQVLESLIERLLARQPEDTTLLTLQERIDSLQAE